MFILRLSGRGVVDKDHKQILRPEPFVFKSLGTTKGMLDQNQGAGPSSLRPKIPNPGSTPSFRASSSVAISCIIGVIPCFHAKRSFGKGRCVVGRLTWYPAITQWTS